MTADASAPPDSPAVATEIAAMKEAWNKRLVMACLTLSAIVAYFAFDMRERPDFVAQLTQIAPWFVALALAFVAVVRWTISRETRRIRAGGR